MAENTRRRDAVDRLERDHDYATDALVSAEWVAQRLDEFGSDDPSLRLVEVDLDTDFYDRGHVPGAVGFDWRSDLRHARRRDIVSPAAFADLLAAHGIGGDSTVVIYGDNSNWFAAHFYWLLSYYGHDDAYLLDGGREHWIESGRPTTTTVPEYTARSYATPGTFEGVRAYLPDVRRAVERETALVDARLPAEYRGEIVAPPVTDEHARRGGHVPGAVNVVWSANLDADGRFKPRPALERLYRDHGVTDDGTVVAYCRIGERSSLTWFVLSELLGYRSVENYDGSWTEWGNAVGVPIETGGARTEDAGGQ